MNFVPQPLPCAFNSLFTRWLELYREGGEEGSAGGLGRRIGCSLESCYVQLLYRWVVLFGKLQCVYIYQMIERFVYNYFQRSFVRSFIRSSVCRPFIVYIDWNEIFNVNLGQGTQKGAEENNNKNEIKSSITKRKNSVSKKCITICVGKMQRKIFICQRVP